MSVRSSTRAPSPRCLLPDRGHPPLRQRAPRGRGDGPSRNFLKAWRTSTPSRTTDDPGRHPDVWTRTTKLFYATAREPPGDHRAQAAPASPRRSSRPCGPLQPQDGRVAALRAGVRHWLDNKNRGRPALVAPPAHAQAGKPPRTRTGLPPGKIRSAGASTVARVRSATGRHLTACRGRGAGGGIYRGSPAGPRLVAGPPPQAAHAPPDTPRSPRGCRK